MVKIIGIGGAGDKAVINTVEKGVIDKKNVLLYNSTMRDIPEDWKSLAIQFTTNNRGGCGKERDLGKELTLDYINSEKVQDLDSFVQCGEEDLLVIIVNSTEGGTGCGSASIMAKYIRDVLGANVMCYAFTGFEEDGRGLQNTIEYFQDMQDYTIQVISNKKFLEGTNKFKAEKAANDEFAKRVSIVMGSNLVDSEQNIDDTDLYKVVTTPGFMTIGYTELNKIKNVNQFDTILTQCIDNDKSLDISTKSVKRIAVMINAKEETQDYIDFSFAVIKDKFGTPYETFTHVQYEEEQPEYIQFIIAGLEMPIDEVNAIYDRYKTESNKVSKRKDNFFNEISELKGNEEDSMFNTGKTKKTNATIDRSKFLNTFKKEIKPNAEIPANSTLDTSITNIENDQFIKKY